MDEIGVEFKELIHVHGQILERRWFVEAGKEAREKLTVLRELRAAEEEKQRLRDYGARVLYLTHSPSLQNTAKISHPEFSCT